MGRPNHRGAAGPVWPDDDPGPITLDASLVRLQKLLGTARPDSLATLTDQWTSLVGSRFAEHCTLRSLHDGVLVVGSADPAVAEQLRWCSADLVAAANAVLGRDDVRSVDVRVVDPPPA